MTKQIWISIPRSAMQELETAPELAGRIREAALESETTGASVEIRIGNGRKTARVYVGGND